MNFFFYLIREVGFYLLKLSRMLGGYSLQILNFPIYLIHLLFLLLDNGEIQLKVSQSITNIWESFILLIDMISEINIKLLALGPQVFGLVYVLVLVGRVLLKHSGIIIIINDVDVFFHMSIWGEVGPRGNVIRNLMVVLCQLDLLVTHRNNMSEIILL